MYQKKKMKMNLQKLKKKQKKSGTEGLKSKSCEDCFLYHKIYSLNIEFITSIFIRNNLRWFLKSYKASIKYQQNVK